MVDRRVAGPVNVTGAQADAARAIVKRDAERGKTTSEAVRAVANASSEFVSAATRLQDMEVVTRNSMDLIVALDHHRSELIRAHPDIADEINAIFEVAQKQFLESSQKILSEIAETALEPRAAEK